MPAGSIRCCDPYPDPIATFVRSTSGTGLLPPNMCLALPIWLNTWSAATHRKSGYMNSTTGRNRPSSASPPPSPANAFSLIGVPRTRPGYFLGRPLVAPLVPPLSLCTSSPSTTIRGSAPIRRSITADTASMNFPRRSSPVNDGALGGPRPGDLRQVAADPDVDERRVGPQLGADAPRARPSRRAPGPARRAPPAAARIASTRLRRARRRRRPRRSARAWSSPRATRSSGSRARHAASSSLVR